MRRNSSVTLHKVKRRNSRRLVIVASITLAIAMILLVPSWRHWLLNSFGVRSSLEVVVVDSETQLPLTNVNVEVDGQQYSTDKAGKVYFETVRLGEQELRVSMPAYKPYYTIVSVGLGNDNQTQAAIVADGARYSFQLTNWLSGEATAGSVSYLQSTALSDENGIASIAIESPQDGQVEFTVEADGYQSKQLNVATSESQIVSAAMVIEQKHYFLARRDGQLNLYSSLADGSQEELILEAAGNETADMRLSVSPDNSKIALVAEREGDVTSGGNRLKGLYIFDIDSRQLEQIERSERIDLLGWAGEQRSRLVYIVLNVDASDNDSRRHRLMSYDTGSDSAVELAASNYFNDVLVADQYIFYAASEAYAADPMPQLVRVNGDGLESQTVFDAEVWTVLRHDYDSIIFDSNRQWYSTDINEIAIDQSSPPERFISRLYYDNLFNTSQSARVDVDIAPQSLILYDTTTKTEKTIYNHQELGMPLHWLDENHLVFRRATATSAADYVINVNGGSPQKIADVYDAAGIDRWYFY